MTDQSAPAESAEATITGEDCLAELYTTCHHLLGLMLLIKLKENNDMTILGVILVVYGGSPASGGQNRQIWGFFPISGPQIKIFQLSVVRVFNGDALNLNPHNTLG